MRMMISRVLALSVVHSFFLVVALAFPPPPKEAPSSTRYSFPTKDTLSSPRRRRYRRRRRCYRRRCRRRRREWRQESEVRESLIKWARLRAEKHSMAQPLEGQGRNDQVRGVRSRVGDPVLGWRASWGNRRGVPKGGRRGDPRGDRKRIPRRGGRA